MNAKLKELHGQQIHIRYKKDGFYRVFVADRYWLDGDVKRPLTFDDDELHVALQKLANVLCRYPQIA